jgi:hypothetical protein
MIRRGILVMASVAFATGALAEPYLDGVQLAETTETSYTFRCGGLISRLAVKERVLPELKGRQLQDRRRVEFLSLAVGGRSLSAESRSKVSEALHRYAWINRVEGRCYPPERRFELYIEGMSAQAWADFNSGASQTRPRLLPIQITVPTNGPVTIS